MRKGLGCVLACWVCSSSALAASGRAEAGNARTGEALLAYEAGLEQQRAGKHDDALRSFRHAIASAPDLPLPYRELAYTHRLRGTLTEAAGEMAFDTILDPALAGPHYGLGFVYAFRRLPEDALEHLDRAIRLEPGLLDAYRYAGQIELELGRFEASRRRARDLLERAEAAGDSRYQAFALNGLGAAALRLGRYGDAARHFLDARAVQRAMGDRQGEWASLNSLGVVYDNLGDAGKALESYGFALYLARGLPHQGWTATTLHNIGVTHARQGRFREARRHLREALRIRRERGDLRDQAYTLAEIGVSYAREGRHPQALRHLEEATSAAAPVQDALLTAILAIARGETHERSGKDAEAVLHYRQALEAAEGIEHPELLWRAERGLGAARLRSGATDLAFAHYARAIDTIEGIRQAVHDPSARTLFLQGKMSAYEGMVAVLHARHRLAPAAGHDRRALEYAQRAKARALLDLLAGARAEVDPTPVALDALQAELDARTVLAEFMLAEGRSFAWLVSREGVQMASLPGRAALERTLARYRDLVQRPPTRASAGTDAIRLGRQLFDRLLSPFAGRMVGATRLIVVPDGSLHYLPFESLVASTDAAGGPRYLIERLEVSYAPSASVLAELRRRGRSGASRALLAYAPDAGRAGGLAPLPHAQDEVRSIAALFAPADRKLALGPAASERALKQEDLAQFRILHLATHGLLDDETPRRSALLLAAEGEEDGLLQPAEILDLGLDADMVVLSACGSGLGRLVRGEGMVGLSRTFLYAGARSLIVSLWNVNDRSSAELMTGFYGRLRGGASRAAALREAKRAMIRSDRPAYRLPYYWAPFVLVGRAE